MHCRFVLVLAMAVLGGTIARAFKGAQTTAGNYELRKQWEIPFKPLRGWALCPDGSAYRVVDKAGGISATSADGKTSTDLVGPIGGAALLACDDRRRLYTAANKNLQIYETDANGRIVEVASTRLKFEIAGLVVAPDGSLFAISWKESAPIVRQLSAEGKILRSFRAGPPLVRSFPGTSIYGPPDYFPVFGWDGLLGRLTISRGNSFGDDVDAMDQQGHWSKAGRAVTNQYGASWLVVLNRVVIWQNQYIAQVQYKSELADAFDVIKLELLDRSFHMVWAQRLDRETGLLQGASADGGLYFMQCAVTVDCKLARYALTPADSAPQN